MDITQEPTTDLDPFALTIEQIDDEQARITAQGPANIDAVAAGRAAPEVLARLRARSQVLTDARAVAVIRGRAAQAAHDRVVRERFDALASDILAAFRARAAALDVWVRDGERLLDDYRATERRLAEFAPLLGPLKPGRELAAVILREKLVLDEHLEHQLAVVGVLPHITVPSSLRSPGFTFEQYVTTRVAQFVNEIRQRLPADDELSPSQEEPHHG